MIRRAHKVLAPRVPPILPMMSPPRQDTVLLRNIGELVTLAGPARARRGPEMRELEILHDAAVFIVDGRINEVGPSPDLETRHASAAVTLDLPGKVVVPGFVDAHTHALFAGSREEELEWKREGLSYREIAARGGGIASTVKKTREATDEALLRETRGRLQAMLRHGTTTAEVKSGYGLSLDQEVRCLRILARLQEENVIDVVPTFLGAHAVPAEYEGRAAEYADLVAGPMLEAVAQRTPARFCDVFVEDGYFTADQGRRILVAARRFGLDARVHADELTASGGAELAADIGAVTADHLLHSTNAGLAELAVKQVIAVLLPGTSFTSRLPYADARKLLGLGLAVALGTDLSPNSWIESLNTVMSVAVHHSGLNAAEALTAVTVNGAYAVGKGGECGTLEAGKRADLLVLDLPTHRQLGYRHGDPVELVLKAGRIAYRRPAPA